VERHLNVLEVGDGSYWNISLGDPSARDIVWNRAPRGRRITVEADLYPEIETARLVRVHEAATHLRAVRPGSAFRANLKSPPRHAALKPGDSMSAVIEADDKNFQTEVLEADRPVLVDFSATWCGPCKKLEPVVHELATEYDSKVKFVRVDVDRAPTTAAKFAVLSVPTLLLLHNGEVKDQVVGLKSKRDLAARIQKVL
jgi:thioredoxin 1